LALEAKDFPSAIALTRQKVNPVRLAHEKMNKCSKGAYEIMRTNKNINFTILSSGSEVSLAIEVSHKLATENIYSKVISMPCHELFDIQNSSYKNEILNETNNIVSIEASVTDYWKKYVGEKGIAIGINEFGKSAPYLKLYENYKITVEDIIKKIKKDFNDN
jgi:transketolase